MKTIAFDNGGKTIDRYTLIDAKTGDMYGSNDSPFHPQGFGQYCGNINEMIDRGQCLGVKSIKAYVNLAKRKPSWLGKEVAINKLPLDVQKLIKQVFDDKDDSEYLGFEGQKQIKEHK